ncbi:MAG: M23 family metallopeptidase [Candidatus Aminicenantes bacterium]|nr:M23 family metallopeptidase [Candidatus Aminicenantes bacterium]
MKRYSFIFLLIFLLVDSGFVLHGEMVVFQTVSGRRVEVSGRSFQPGEVLKITIDRTASIDKATVHFLDKKLPMLMVGSQKHFSSLIGLDLDVKAGAYPLRIRIDYKNGSVEMANSRLLVTDKEFPVKELWVKEEYVTPPPETLDRIRRESRLLRLLYTRLTPNWLGEGNFCLPLQGKVFPNFGERRIFNNKPRSPHGGVDISAPSGTPVAASNSGTVVLAEDLYFAGKTVIIDHGLGVFSMYCHFSEILADEGEKVRKGDVIGEVGATGRVTGPHLHWGIKIHNSRVDPFSLLSLVLEQD